MSLADGSGSSSASESAALGDLLAFFGTVADYAAGVAAAHSERVAAVAVAIGTYEQLPQSQLDSLAFAARLRNIGALGNPAFAKNGTLSDRARSIATWDVPAHGARLCERIAALPRETADIVRWQAESWDGTGYPDQLRWMGIPRAARILHLACDFAAASEPEDAFARINAESGREFGPEQTRSFDMWYHASGGDVPPARELPALAAADGTTPEDLLQMIAGALDAHNGTPGRAHRIAGTTVQLLERSGAPQTGLPAARQAALLFAAGEVRSAELEHERFDPLARLGIQMRSEHAVRAADLLQTCPPLREAAAIVRARAEWFDGTGGPDGLRGAGIPAAARALALAIADDALEQPRLQTAAGTQFDPAMVEALAALVKAQR